MKIKFILAALAVAMVPAMASAQEEGAENPWFVQGALGAQYSVGGGAGLGEMLSPAGQIAVGKHFNPYIGARLTFGGWRGQVQSQRGLHGFYDWHATVDGMWDMFQTFNHEYDGPVKLRLIAGVGFDRAYERPSSSLLVRLGLSMDVRLCKAIDFNLEYQANGVSDRWNGKDDHSFDTFMDLLVGVTYKFGTGYKCPTCVVETPVKKLNERTNAIREVVEVEKIVRDTVEIIKEVPAPAPERIERTVQFTINRTEVMTTQEDGLVQIAEYMKKYPDAVATVMGYADKGTGTVAINLRLAKERAENVANFLVNRLGIQRSRLSVSSMTNEQTQQPFAQNDLNRVVIVVAYPK